MLALIMAGGAGRRLMAGEKPLLLVNNRPMVAWIVDAFLEAGCDPVVVTSPQTPMTSNWCRAQGITALSGSGRGYIEDMIEAALARDEQKPLFVSVADLPCIRPDSIRLIRRRYEDSGKDACSVWVPASLTNAAAESMPYHETVDGIDACPSGINILRGDLITQPQDELRILLRDYALAFNVNTGEDRDRAEDFFRLNGRDCN